MINRREGNDVINRMESTKFVNLNKKRNKKSEKKELSKKYDNKTKNIIFPLENNQKKMALNNFQQANKILMGSTKNHNIFTEVRGDNRKNSGIFYYLYKSYCLTEEEIIAKYGKYNL